MKKQTMFLRLLCVLCATLMLLGVLSACGNNNTPDPTDPPAEPTDPQNPTDGSEDPTDGSEDPTEGSGGNVDDPDSPIMDGDGHIEIPW